MAYFHKRNGKHAFTIDLGRDPLTGKRKQTTRSGFRTEREARKAARQLENEKDDGTLSVNNITYDEVHDMWLEQKNLKGSTYRNRMYMMKKHVLPYLGDRKIKDITPLVAAHWMSHLRNTPSIGPSTIESIRAKANTVFNYAVDLEIIHRSPLQKQSTPIPKAKRKIWNEDELEYFLAYIRYHSKYWLGHYLAAVYGLRIAEVATLRKMDRQGDYIFIQRAAYQDEEGWKVGSTKTPKSERQLFLSDMMKEKWDDYIEELDVEDWLFPGRKREFVTTDTIRYDFKERVKEAGLPLIKHHGMRATIITYLLNQGVPAHDVAQMVGHANTATTFNDYATATDEGLKRIADTSNRLIGGTNGGIEGRGQPPNPSPQGDR